WACCMWRLLPRWALPTPRSGWSSRSPRPSGFAPAARPQGRRYPTSAMAGSVCPVASLPRAAQASGKAIQDGHRTDVVGVQVGHHVAAEALLGELPRGEAEQAAVPACVVDDHIV